MSAFATASIPGRLGTYTLDIYDVDNATASIGAFEIENDVVLNWGDRGRDYPGQVLKSHTRIQVRTKVDALEEVFSGGFNPLRFPVHISGPRVAWTGFVRPEQRALPYSSRVRPNSLSLLIADSFSKAEGVKSTDLGQSPLDAVRDAFGAVEDLSGLGFTEEARVLWEGTFTDKDGATYTVADDLTMLGESSLYDRTISFMRLMGARVYRSLSEGGTYMHPYRLTGSEQSYTSKDSGGTRSTSTRSGSAVVVSRSDVEIQDGREYEDVEEAGTIQLDLGSGYSLVRGGNSVAITADPSYTFVISEALSPDGELAYVIVNDPGVGTSLEDTIEVNLGTFSPTDPLGFAVDWEVQLFDTVSNNLLAVRVKDGGGAVIGSTSDGIETTEITTTTATTSDSYTVEFEGRGVRVFPRVRLFDGVRIVEELYAERDLQSLAPVEIEPVRFPYFGTGYLNLGDTPETYESPVISPAAVQPALVYAQQQSSLRPAGLWSIEASVRGLHGPETLLVLEVPGGETGAFVCGEGRSVNLTTGVTEISDVQIPDAELPTDTANLL